jgi:hypothetical protein
MTRIRFDGCDLSPRAARTPRCAQTIRRAAAGAVVLLLLLTGCGGGGRMAKPDYELQVNDAGKKLSQVFGSIDQGRRNLHQLDVRVTRARRTLDQVRTQLAGVKPPKKAERAHRQLVVALDMLSDDLGALAAAAAKDDQAAVNEARARLSTPARQLVAAIQQLQQAGFDINNGKE